MASKPFRLNSLWAFNWSWCDKTIFLFHLFSPSCPMPCLMPFQTVVSRWTPNDRHTMKQCAKRSVVERNECNLNLNLNREFFELLFQFLFSLRRFTGALHQKFFFFTFSHIWKCLRDVFSLRNFELKRTVNCEDFYCLAWCPLILFYGWKISHAKQLRKDESLADTAETFFSRLSTFFNHKLKLDFAQTPPRALLQRNKINLQGENT